LKLFIFYFTEKKWDAMRFFGAGGMPSTHSALSACVAVTIGFKEGWEFVALDLQWGFYIFKR